MNSGGFITPHYKPGILVTQFWAETPPAHFFRNHVLHHMAGSPAQWELRWEFGTAKKTTSLPVHFWHNCRERGNSFFAHTHTDKSLTPPQAKPLHPLTVEEWRNRRISKVTVSLQHPLQTHLHRPTGLLPSYLALQKCSEALWANVGTTSLPTPTVLPWGRRSVSVVFF